ncbi:hypothetical protein AB6D11_18595 [Vibrio splendidus]
MTDTQSKDLRFGLLLAAFSLHHDRINDEFYASDALSETRERMLDALNRLWGEDVLLNDEWYNLFFRASQAEISRFVLDTTLSLTQSALPSGDALYVAVLNAPEFGPFDSVVTLGLTIDSPIDTVMVTKADPTWDLLASEHENMQALTVGDGMLQVGNGSVSVFRVR